MTSDAKIGLLLGLVFIFIIAFIINGLPKLRGQGDSNELTNNMVRNTPPGIGWGGNSDEVIDPQREVTEETVQPQPSSPGQVQPPSPVQEQSIEHSQTASDDPHLRHLQDMPAYSPLVENAFPRNTFGQQQRQTSWGPVRMTADEAVLAKGPSFTFRPAPPKGVEEEKSVTIAPPKPVEQKESVTIRPPRPVKPKTYLVISGDSLGSIAKKMYGPVEGNKRANVAKIFEANRELLKSADEIKVGQKLVIPALPAKATGGGLFSGSMFKEVRSIGKRTTDLSVVPKTVKTKIYTVKDGDSLWSISTDLLGNGIRYKEIAKLNKDVLPSEDDVRVGTKLKIPAK